MVPVFRGTRVPVHMIVELAVPSRGRAHVVADGKCGAMRLRYHCATVARPHPMHHAGAGEPVKALWLGYPNRARADAQKTLGEFFGEHARGPQDRRL